MGRMKDRLVAAADEIGCTPENLQRVMDSARIGETKIDPMEEFVIYDTKMRKLLKQVCAERDALLDMAKRANEFWGFGTPVRPGSDIANECKRLVDLVESVPGTSINLITIEVDGGVVTKIHNIPLGVAIEVRDYDIEGTEEGELGTDADGMQYVATAFTGE